MDLLWNSPGGLPGVHISQALDSYVRVRGFCSGFFVSCVTTTSLTSLADFLLHKMGSQHTLFLGLF